MRRLVETALEEDGVDLDVSSAAFDRDDVSTARLVARNDLVLAGFPLVELVYDLLGADLKWSIDIEEGECVPAGETFARTRGATIELLRGERVALNFLQRTCGIATKTARYADALGDDGPDILDTRKTLPGYREIDKYAVRQGGGHNHRYNLGGGIIVKENHVRAAGGIRAAVEQIREVAPPTLKIEVETTDLAEVETALEAGAEMIMLDNMSNDEMREAIARIREEAGDRVDIEASGGITESRLPSLAELDLDFVSSGALTHSVEASDVSMLFEESST
jgi:nicotinate-nucleotide pyrophosphorylase (carboxylating)